jgi:cytochrome c-type biogenesis protein CcsB
MRIAMSVVAIVIASFAPVGEDLKGRAEFDWGQWRDVPVQNGGRRKPLDTLAWETLRLVGNRSSLTDPETGERLNATAAYLTLIFDWQGWDHERRDRLLLSGDWRPQYSYLHQADKWDQLPLLPVDYLDLQNTLGLEKDQRQISPAALSKTLVHDARTERRMPFPAWGDQLAKLDSERQPLSRVEKKALELADRLSSYQNHRMGRGMEILPVKDSGNGEWLPLAHLIVSRFDDASDPTGQYRQLQASLREARTAYHNADIQAFNRASDEFKTGLSRLGSELGEYPSTSQMGLEVTYNRWAPFRIAWVSVLLAAVCMLLHLGSRWRVFSVVAWLAYAAGMAAMVTGFCMRIAISGRAPVTNMYESVVYVGFGVAIIGLIFELIYRRKYILTAAAAVSTVALVLADNCPLILDPSLRPLEPVLRSNFWLSTHVTTITLSYAAFALALGIANITLGYLVVRSSNREAISALSRFTYKAIQVGVLLLSAGIILGGVWADYSWGRFWGWDPKEVWALVALLGYLCVLHARFAGLVGHRGLAALAVVCFSLVVMAWYGVNFVLGAGLHSYGFGGGGQGWVYAAVILQLAFAGAALLRSRPRDPGDCNRSDSPDSLVIQERIKATSDFWEERQQFAESSQTHRS